MLSWIQSGFADTWDLTLAVLKEQAARWSSAVVLKLWYAYTSGTRGLFRWYASSFAVILKSFFNSFLCYNSFVSYANVANSFICYINLKYILCKLHSSETRGVHSNIKKTSGGRRSQKVWEPLVWCYDSRFGCERSRVQIPDEPYLLQAP